MTAERWQQVKHLFQSKKFHEVLSVAPHNFGGGVSLPRNDRLIYFSLLTTEANIWLMTLE
jgi:hypothetical protein